MVTTYVAGRRAASVPPSRSRHLRRKVHRVLNFEKYTADANHFINMVADELDCDRNTAARVTRAVLHAIRDRIAPDDAVEFAQGLPMALKGVYFDQFDLSKVPVRIRRPEDFISYIRYLDGVNELRELRTDRDVEDGIAAVFRVLEQTMDYGQVEQIKWAINDNLAYMLY